MARNPRLFYPGAVYHVLLRGNAGQDIFFENQDQEYLYRLRQEGHEKFGSQVSLDRILERVCPSYRIEVASLNSAGRQHRLSEVRAIISWIVRETKHLSLTELSKRLKRDISSLSVASRRLVERSKFEIIWRER